MNLYKHNLILDLQTLHAVNILETSQNNITFNLKNECEIDNVRKALLDQFITGWYQLMLRLRTCSWS